MAVEGRVVKKGITVNPELGDCGNVARLLFTWGLIHADSAGRLTGDPRKLKTIVFPACDDIRVPNIEAALRELAEHGLVTWYAVDGKPVLLFNAFEDHQPPSLLKKEAASKLPEWGPGAVSLVEGGGPPPGPNGGAPVPTDAPVIV